MGSATPPPPLAQMDPRGDIPPGPQDMWRPAVGTSSTPPQPQMLPGAAAAAALGASQMPPDTGRSSSRLPSQRDVQAASDAGSIIEVTLSKEPGFERFGFANVPTRDNRSLVISWVDAAGLLQMKWNRLVDASQQVSEGYRIVSVNGRSDNVEAMRDELQKPQVQLLVQRATAQ